MKKSINVLRKIMSLAIIAFAALYYFIRKNEFAIFLTIIITLFIIFDLINYFSKNKNKLSRLFFKLYPKKKEEIKQPLTDATIFLILTLILTILLPKEIVIFALILYTIVDGTEQIFGIALDEKTKIPWNKYKTIQGTFAGFVSAIIASYIIIKFITPTVPLSIILPVSFISALAGTSKKYDNEIILSSIALILWLMI